MAKRQQPNDDQLADPLGAGDAAGETLENEGAVLAQTTPPPAAEKEKPAPRSRQGDEHRPRCPNCSTDKAPVLCAAKSSTPMFTYYGCPNGCGYTEKKPRPQMRERLARQRAEDEANQGFSARPKD